MVIVEVTLKFFALKIVNFMKTVSKSVKHFRFLVVLL